MTKFIAELGESHCQGWDKTKRLIQASKIIGCDAVKFQYYTAEKLWHKSMPENIAAARKNELPHDFLQVIKPFCKSLNMDVGFSVFDIDDIETVAPFCDFLKVASYEFLWWDLIKSCLDTGLPLMISTGLCTEDEIFVLANKMATMETGHRPGENLTMFQCVANYPAKVDECNLAVMSEYKKMFQTCNIGWSDHTCLPGVIYKSVGMGVDTIEFHTDFKQDINNNHTWCFSDMQDVINNVRVGEQAVGTPTKCPIGDEVKCRALRADPEDGMRPLKGSR